MEKKITYYTEILTKEEIQIIGLLIKKFENKEISYQELKKLLNDNNIIITPYIRDFNKFKMTIKNAEELKNRIISETFIPNDLIGYFISSDTYTNVLIKYDRTMLEILAEYGDEYSKEVLQLLIKFETANKHNRRKNRFMNHFYK